MSVRASSGLSEVREAPAPPHASIDRERLRVLLAEEDARFRRAHTRSAELWERAQGSLLAGVPMHWMTRVGERVPGLGCRGPRRPFRRRRRARVRRPVPRRHRRDGRSLPPPAVAAAVAAQAARGITSDAAVRGRDLGGRGARPGASAYPSWQFAAHGDRREPLHDPSSRARSRAGRRCSSSRGATTAPSTSRSRSPATTAAPSPAPRNVGPPVDLDGDDEGLRVQRRRGARVKARPTATSPASSPSPRSRTSASSSPTPASTTTLRELTRKHGNPARDRRDAHDLGRPGRVHARTRARARRAHDREDDRGRRPPAAAYGFSARTSATGSPPALPPTKQGVPAASAAHWPETPSRSPPRAPCSGEVLTEAAFERMIAARANASRDGCGRTRSQSSRSRGASPDSAAGSSTGSEQSPARTGGEAAATGLRPRARRVHAPPRPHRGVLLTPFHNMALMLPEPPPRPTSTAIPRCSGRRSSHWWGLCDGG